MITLPKPLPQDIEAERLVLSCILQRPDLLVDPDMSLRPEDFYRPDHGALFALVRDMHASKAPIEDISVSERVHRVAPKAGTVAEVLALFELSPSSQAWGYYAERVRDLAQKRELYRALEARLSDVLDPNTTAREVHGRMTAQLASATPDVRVESLGQVAARVLLTTDDRQQGKGRKATRTHFQDLDEKLVGLDAGALVVLAARPGIGKSAFALEVAHRVARDGRAVLFLSLEMGREQVVSRLLSSLAGVELRHIRAAQLNEFEWTALNKAQQYVARLPLHIDDKPRRTVQDIAAMARRIKQGGTELGLIVVDYLQLMQPDDIRAPREQQIAGMSRGLKILSAELGVPVMALSQLNRDSEKRANRRPILADLRESGAIEQDAEVILFLFRDPDSDDDSTVEVLIEKHRNGETGMVRVGWEGRYVRFKDNNCDL